MQCAKCGADNKTGAKFCISCGSSMGGFCPNCGTANTAGAKFCVSCGYQFGVPAVQAAVLSQPVMVVRTGIPGWLWALIGVLVGILVIGGLIISGILPFGAASTEQASPPLQPVSESPEASSVSIVEPEYCPETGGVILYWNAGYDCANETGDPGYRLRYGDGFQDLNTGQFDDQASSIRIPPGWSVRLYESVEQNGASHCFNTSVTNFEDLGNFDNRNLPINDNVTSMQVFRDGTCGQDLAAGAEPAPMPEDEELPEGALEAQAGGCDCECVRGLFADSGVEAVDGNWWNIPFDDFWDKYSRGGVVSPPPGLGGHAFDNSDGVLEKIINDPNLSMSLGCPTVHGGYVEISTNPLNPSNPLSRKYECTNSGNDELACVYDYRSLGGQQCILNTYSLSIIYSPNPEEIAMCLIFSEGSQRNLFAPDQGGGPGGDEPQLDCRNYGCPSGEECVEYKQFGTFGCEPIQQQSQPSGDDQSGGSSGGCTAGCWCEIGGVWGCWQSCNSWCVDP